MYESVCRICNPVSSQKEGKNLEGYKPRVGVCIGETLHTIHERSMEHVIDARFFLIQIPYCETLGVCTSRA